MLAKALLALVITMVTGAILHGRMPIEIFAMLDFIILVILFAPKADETMFDRQYARYTAWKASRTPTNEPVASSEPWHAKARKMFQRRPGVVEASRPSNSRRATQSRKSPDWVDPYLDPPEIKVRDKIRDKQKAA